MKRRTAILLGALAGSVLIFLKVQAMKNKTTMAGAAADLASSAAQYLARGLRNNNPGNIRIGQNWQGEAAANTDGVFEQYITPQHGIRAMGKILDSYAKRGIVTLREIIATWAPNSENDTAAYIAAVSRDSGLHPDAQINHANRAAVVAAIIKHENGLQPYTSAMIAEGLALA